MGFCFLWAAYRFQSRARGGCLLENIYGGFIDCLAGTVALGQVDGNLYPLSRNVGTQVFGINDSLNADAAAEEGGIDVIPFGREVGAFVQEGFDEGGAIHVLRGDFSLAKAFDDVVDGQRSGHLRGEKAGP